MKRINALDAAWLAVDSDETPMHIGNMQIFITPKGAPTSFLTDMVARMRASDVVPPWIFQLVYPGILGRKIMPIWKKAKDIDLDYHIRHSALPKPGGERELGILISRLHSNHLDFQRPLWEVHIIEGLARGRFAIYTKIHHSLIDGISGIRVLERSLTKDPTIKHLIPPWGSHPKRKPRRTEDDQIPTAQAAILEAIKVIKQVSTIPSLAGALGKLAYSGTLDPNHELAAPFVGPQSILNNRVSGQRRFATQQYSLTKLKSLAKKVDGSLNDLVLYLCGTALRRFLLESNSLPEQPLTAGIPVNIRPADDTGTGTAISFMIASLATNVADPLRRLETIKQSTQTAKEHLQSLPRAALTQYTMLMMSPYILQLLTGLGGRMRPAFNFTISNVPGPDEVLYYEGAKMEAMYPLSLIAHGGALNITCMSYADSLNFGFTGCRDTLPRMQRLAVYSGEALEELAKLVNPRPKARARRKQAS